MIQNTGPERLESRERYRHDHDQNPLPDLHGQGVSYRASAEYDRIKDNYPQGQHKSSGELSYEEQYRTDGEAKNYRGSLDEERFGEYPRYGKSLSRRSRTSTYNYRGIGPKGYKRSDQRIEEDICDALARDPYIDASDITVMVQNGEVLLSGTVNEREDRFAVEMIIDTILGVEEIENNLRIKRENRQLVPSTEYI